MTPCASCGAPNPRLRRTCYACHEPLQRAGAEASPSAPVSVATEPPRPSNPSLHACPSCGHSVSLLASACPRCGHPFTTSVTRTSGILTSAHRKALFWSLALTLVGCAGWVWLGAHLAYLNRGAELAGRLSGQTGIGTDTFLGQAYGSTAAFHFDRTVSAVGFWALPPLLLGLLIFAIWVWTVRPDPSRLTRVPLIGRWLR